MDISSELFSKILAIFLGFGVLSIFISFVIGVLAIVALWRLFTKAGYAGWKSLIPIYNSYIYVCIIAGEEYWYYMFLPLAFSLLTRIPLIGFVFSILGLVIAFLFNYNLHKSYGASDGLAVVGFFFPVITYLMMGFGNEYIYTGPKMDLIALKNRFFK